MTDEVKIALIGAVAAVVAAIGIAWTMMYYSPYQTCVRAKLSHTALEVARLEEEGSRAAAVGADAAVSSSPIEPVEPITMEDVREEATLNAQIARAGGD